MPFRFDAPEQPTYTLADAIIATLDLCDAALNEPKGGAEPIVPTAEHYNALQDLLRDIVRTWSGPQAASSVGLVRLLNDHGHLEDRLVNAAYPGGVIDALRVALRDIRAATPIREG
ncbi:MAG: hypothetical protein EPN91_12035 [Salinibacterium sp.]|nr:MAG: hypothetical protein EPN91_12035 [Salinibacterium sp.]